MTAPTTCRASRPRAPSGGPDPIAEAKSPDEDPRLRFPSSHRRPVPSADPGLAGDERPEHVEHASKILPGRSGLNVLSPDGEEPFDAALLDDVSGPIPLRSPVANERRRRRHRGPTQHRDQLGPNAPCRPRA